MRRLFLLRTFLFIVVPLSSGQDLTGEFTTCSDKLKLCHLQCVAPKERTDTELAWPANQPMTKAQVELCVDKCDEQKSKCFDSEFVTETQDCVLGCSRKYDTAMKMCVAMVSDTKRSTFGENLDECSVTASAQMDTCTGSCTGIQDYKLGGWSFPDDMEEVKAKYTSLGQK